jgi:serine/threonine-protein kinase
MATPQDRETVTQGTSLAAELFARVRAVFEAAMERPAAERRAFAAGACAGDVGLLREVERMLDADDKSGPLLKVKRSSSAPDEGRFPAGTILGERYRILGLLGKGGMGEVYRAHDLKLEQQVALKFLPPGMARNSRLLERFRGEVRIARQISHRNVCRVYDLGEIDGAPFISMEYVDGEDLGSLLRRIGRLPGDKALEFARRLCAGLAAAHEKGVLHRDLKPANIMIDGRGQVLIMDFGLAAVADAVAAGDIRSGTPAYMAPEQKDGREVTVRSDLYSLGLVFAEMFSGLKASAEGKLTATVKDLDPAVEKAIERCLSRDPARRPESALALARMLPGGDPLAEALAAGETPSPEMVADSEDTGVVSIRAAIVCLASIIAGLVVLVVFANRVNVLRQTPFIPDPPEVLARKARDLLVRFGYSEPPVDSESDFVGELGYTNWAARHLTPEQIRDQLAHGQPSVMTFWHRESSEHLATINIGAPVSPDDPPLVNPGDIEIRIDPQGRLTSLLVVSPAQGKNPVSPIDWNLLFEAAGLDSSHWSPVQPEHILAVPFDARAEWAGTYAHAPYMPVRLEAASWQGRPVYFRITGPWPPFSQGPPAILRRIVTAMILGGLALATFLAWRHYRSGRGDLRGAWQLAILIFSCDVLSRVLYGHHLLNVRAFSYGIDSLVGSGLFSGASAGILYIALEPYIRKKWPQSLISWTRLVTRGPRDPLVGGHVLIGVALGFLFAIVVESSALLASETTLRSLATWKLQGVAGALARLLQSVSSNVFIALAFLFFVFLLRALLRRTWLTVMVAVAFTALLTTDTNSLAQSAFVGGFIAASQVLTLLRFGVLPTIIAGFLGSNLIWLVSGSDFSAWYAAPANGFLLLVLALTAWSFWTALGKRKLFKFDLLES